MPQFYQTKAQFYQTLTQFYQTLALFQLYPVLYDLKLRPIVTLTQQISLEDLRLVMKTPQLPHVMSAQCI